LISGRATWIDNTDFEDTGFAYTLSLISGKHKMVIPYCLMAFETVFLENEKISGKGLTNGKIFV
jgi:hypothetical protein